MTAVQIDRNALLEAIKDIPANSPIVMVNLLRYRDQADYGNRSMPPCSGRVAYYQRYAVPTFEAIRNLGGRVLWFGHVQVPLFAPQDERWDDVLLVEYPSFACVLSLVNNPLYQVSEVHRTAALLDTRVMATTTAHEIA
ncbi:MAG: hypothetical protein M0P39_07480 [Rhodocyclaceae bacterium]|jgi:uncharacterized protein (DUF1330 family)|nr:hypothetical protein [Rhodocyclaceae bacterium]